ncbi:hypothetical protein Tel_05620 [Candidatus Tenderia electrophaga]|uniref:Cyclic di-GMP receptor atypical PilZ domain-containing protein n=1 Tax=Candidatus Tenderia electrophaga TaxID=1748243 RepID=A0A0S2TBW4_9GAMM|nr:hypothetical protein Tel_05620 [Candidatus Tenderia electrophaga]
MTEASELSGLFCELSIPFEWTAADKADTATAVTPAEELANQNCLKIVLGLDDVSHDANDDVLEVSYELQRLDFKVNVILELVGQLVSQNLSLPARHAVKLGPSSIRWRTQASPAEVGQRLRLKLFPDQRFPFPLCLRGRVATLEQVEQDWEIRLELDQMHEYTQDLLEKYIFRCHRRHIARMKTQINK